MKKILAFLLVLLVFSSVFVLAKNNQIGASGKGSGNNEKTEQEETEEDESIIDSQEDEIEAEESKGQLKKQEKAQTHAELQQMIQAKEQEMESNSEENRFRNQNQVRLAVHALLSMEDLVGGIGKNVSAIAREFNNSVQATIRAEERIQKRSFLARFFAGGDEEAADEIKAEVNKNQIMIQELKQLYEECDCSEGLRQTWMEQIQNMEQEQTRLMELAQKEKGSKGLFGWLWK